MANVQAMSTIKSVLVNTQGVTGDMLFNGLELAVQDRPEERHELQAQLVKMVSQVLSAAQTAAKGEAEGTCQRKVDAAQAELSAKKVVLSSAIETLEAAQTTVKAQKDKLENCRQQQASEEEEHKRAEAADAAKAQEVAVNEQGKAEVVRLLEGKSQQLDGDSIVVYQTYLRSVNAEPTLVAALRSALEKESSQRCGFDCVAMEHLQSILEHKIREWDAVIAAVTVAKANVHAEALGAWAIRELAGEHVQEAEVELEAAEAAVAVGIQQLKSATEGEQHEEAVLAHYLTDLTLAGEKLRQCGDALEALLCVEAGPEVLQEVAPVLAAGVDVDVEMAAEKMDTAMDIDMCLPLVA